MTSSFVFDDAEQARAMFADEMEGDIYSRYSNPNTSELVNKMVQLEDAEDGLAFSSGMAAVFAGFAGLLQAGDHIVASRSLFGSTHQILTNILPKWQISHTYVDANHPDKWEAAIQKNTKVLFLETPSNPGLDLIDLEWAAQLKKEQGLILAVDNCFATPILQNPMKLGADLVIHSTTKFIDGQGRTIGGVMVGKRKWIEPIRTFARQTGPCMSPLHAWLLSKSLETLSLRMGKHCENALALAQWLDNHPELLQVKYPFLPSHPQHDLAQKQMKMGGGLVTIEVKGGMERAKRFIDSTKLVSITSNLGDTRTTITHPASTTHSKLTEDERRQVGITQGLIRISVGLEDVQDIQQDLKQALEASR